MSTECQTEYRAEHEQVMKLPFKIEDVYNAYAGKDGCACGCGGKYYYRDIKDAEDWQLFSKEQSKHTRGIKFVYNKLNRLAEQNGLAIEVQDDYIYYIEVDGKAWRIYLRR